jgi:hypothetical protein
LVFAFLVDTNLKKIRIDGKEQQATIELIKGHGRCHG